MDQQGFKSGSGRELAHHLIDNIVNCRSKVSVISARSRDDGGSLWSSGLFTFQQLSATICTDLFVKIVHVCLSERVITGLDTIDGTNGSREDVVKSWEVSSNM
jgi:hypothetical protein